MIEFDLYHHCAKIKKFDNPNEVEDIKKFLTIFQKNFLPKNGQLYTIDKIYDEVDLSFPIGYANVLFTKLKEKNIKYKFNDLRVFNYHLPKPNLLQPIAFELHETQKEAFEEISKNNTGIIASATGSGKSILILKTILLRGGNCLLIAPTENIREQLTELFKTHLNPNIVSNDFMTTNDDWYIQSETDKISPVKDKPIEVQSKNPLDRIGSLFSKERENNPSEKSNNPLKKMNSLFTKDTYKQNNEESPESKYMQSKKYLEVDSKEDKKELKKLIKKINKKNKQITIICWQSLNSVSVEFLKKINTVIVDECHVAGVASIRKALFLMENAQFRYFYSATPWRDIKAQFDLLLSSIGTNLIYDLGGKEASDKGIISKARFEMVETPKPKEYLDPKKYKHPSKKRLLKVKGIIANETRNACIVEEALKLYENNFNVFIAVDEIGHLELLQERFKQHNIEILPIHSQMNKSEIDKNIKTVGQHNPQEKGGLISIGTMTVGVGTDMRNITAVILASGGKSSIRMIQRIGRGSRKTTDEFVVIDFFDWFNPDLLKHSITRLQVFKEEFEELRDLDQFFSKYNNV